MIGQRIGSRSGPATGDQSPGDGLPAVTPLQCTEKHAATSKRIGRSAPRSIFSRSEQPGERGEGPDYGKIHPRTCEREERQNHQGQEAPERPEKKGGGTDQDTGRKRTRPPRAANLPPLESPTVCGTISNSARRHAKRGRKSKKTYIPETIRPRSAPERDKNAAMQDRKALCPLPLSKLC